MLPEIKQRSLQIIVLGLMMAAVGHFADSPTYKVMNPSQTELRLVIRHSGVLIGACEMKPAEELEKLPANMRQPMNCPREKSPLSLELLVNDEVLHRGVVRPSGIHDDGVLALYQNFRVPGGSTDIELRVKDQVDLENYNYTLRETLELSRDSVILIEFTDQGISFSQPGLGA